MHFQNCRELYFASVNPKAKDPYRSLLYQLSGKSFFAIFKLNFSHCFPVCCLTKFRFLSVCRCFKRALKIDGSNSSLWEEVCSVSLAGLFIPDPLPYHQSIKKVSQQSIYGCDNNASIPKSVVCWQPVFSLRVTRTSV